MRLLTLFLAGTFALTVPALSASERETMALPDTGPAAPEPTPEARLNSLFEALKSTADPDAAKDAENDIVKIWLDSGSDTVDLLMTWALGAMEEKNYNLALDYLDRIIAMKPNYAEGWNKRATVHFLVDDYPKAIADIEQTLALEPRHFGALSGLGTIMRDIGDDERAVTAYRYALEIDPYLDSVKDALKEIEDEKAGREL